nr:manganese efflux pump [Clostridium fessum]
MPLFLSMIETAAGHLFGLCLKARTEISGGVILIFMGVKILAEHLHLF